MISKETVAKELYEAYCKSVGGIAFNGDPLPNWETFSNDETKKKQSNAWLDTAQAAIDFLRPLSSFDLPKG